MAHQIANGVYLFDNDLDYIYIRMHSSSKAYRIMLMPTDVSKDQYPEGCLLFCSNRVIEPTEIGTLPKAACVKLVPVSVNHHP
jgi:hypothetical protein